jgi:hypothetical protein
MMDRELNIFLGLVVFLFVIVGGCTATVNYNDNQSIEELVKSGSDPIDARCAIRGSAKQECIVRVATKIHSK